ncbi:hypothetical protein H101_07924, partial [Trichophyton interdigitale H6]
LTTLTRALLKAYQDYFISVNDGDKLEDIIKALDDLKAAQLAFKNKRSGVARCVGSASVAHSQATNTSIPTSTTASAHPIASVLLHIKGRGRRVRSIANPSIATTSTTPINPATPTPVPAGPQDQALPALIHSIQELLTGVGGLANPLLTSADHSFLQQVMDFVTSAEKDQYFSNSPG